MEGFDATQGMATLEEALAMLASAPEPWRHRLPELAREGALDAVLCLPTAKSLGRRLPFWAQGERGFAMGLARLCLPPGDCSFALRARAALPMGASIWTQAVAMLACDAPEALASSGEPGWMGGREAARALKYAVAYKGDQARAAGAMEALLESGAWAPGSGADWAPALEMAEKEGWREAAAWARAGQERCELGRSLAAAASKSRRAL